MQGVQLGGAVVSTAPINIIVHSTLLVQLRQLHPLSKCSNVLVCKVIKKVSFLQSPFVVIRRLLSPIPSAVRSDSVRHPIRFRPPSDRIPSAARRTTTATYRPKAFHIAPIKPPQLYNCHILLRKCYIHLVDRIILLKFVSCDTNAMK